MNRPATIGLAASAAAAALVLAACEGSGGGGPGPSPPAGYNAAITKVVNPSSHKGGTLTFADSGAPDSADPGNTSDPFMWNLARLYTMTLMTYKSERRHHAELLHHRDRLAGDEGCRDPA